MRSYLFLPLTINSVLSLAQPYPSINSIALSQQPIRNQFDHLSVEDGLSTNSVGCILQDREGFMWFGTSDGLNKYNGHTFTVFRPNPVDTAHSFRSNQISGMCEGRQNRLWVATAGGLHEIDKSTGRVTPHPIRVANADRWNYQHSVYEDSQGVVWVSTLGGLGRYQPALHRFTLFPVPQPEATIKTVFEDPQHRFWVATFQGLYLFDRSTGRFTLIPVEVAAGAAQPAFIAFHLDSRQVLWLATATSGYGLFQVDLRRPWQLKPYNPDKKINPFTFLNALHGDEKGIFWLATTTGLQRIDPVRHQVFTYRPDLNAPKAISSNTAQAVYHDRAGTLWVGTDNGIDRQTIVSKPFMTHQVRPNAGRATVPENKVVALLPDHTGRFWVSNGYHVYRPALDGNHSQKVVPQLLGSDGQFKNYVQALHPDGDKGIWLGTWRGLYYFDQATGRYSKYPSEVPVEYISEAPSGEMWVGGEVTPSSGIASFDPRTHRYRYYKYRPDTPGGLPSKYVRGLLVSRSGDVWVLFTQRGIARLNPRSGHFTYYTARSKSRLTSNDVQTIYEDETGIVWVGTNQGVNRFDPRTGLFSAITTRDGLPGNTIVAITGDRSGRLWMSTNKGLCRLDTHTNAIHTYQTTDGLPSNDFLRNAVFRRGNRLYFGSLNGVVHFNPDSIRNDTRPFPVRITEFSVMDQPRAVAGSVAALDYDENFLSFGFAALTYARPERNQYAYQLVGVDRNWVKNGNRHVANYTNLSPGSYTFRVKAANSDGIWNTGGASLRLVIRPPWWATWWAYGLYALLVSGAVWGYIRFYTNRIRQQQAMELSRRETAQLRTVDELKTRFFSNITHEFRTPLSLILTPIEKLLREDHVDPPTRQTLSLVQRNADQLLRLINQLLDLSKLEANHMPVSLMRGEVVEFVGCLIESFRPMAEQKEIHLAYTAESSATEYLFDADKWEKILTNLLSNALKFTADGGGVTATLAIVAPTATDGIAYATIQIADSGIGIPSENLSHIFDRFYQVDMSRTRAYEGTGIGLALVKELVDLIGGRIRVESQPGIGSTFALVLPLEPASADAGVLRLVLPDKKPGVVDRLCNRAISDNHSNNLHAPLILIVEDNAELRGFLATELAATYRVLQAADGEQGWHLTRTELPDVVISDVMMPRMDGNVLTHLIKNHPDTDHIAVIILSAKAAHSSRVEGLKKGADDYMAKPFHLDELHLRLRNQISRQQKLRDQYRQQFARHGVADSIDSVEDTFLHRVYEFLESHLSDPSLSVDHLADELAMSRKTLYRKMHSLVHLNPHELIRQYRLNKAADLLRAGHTASQTAYLTGFSTPSYFATVFKEFYHKTPTEFVSDSVGKA